MAKTLNQFLEGYLKVKNPDEQKFVDKHVVAKHSDRNGNDDEVFKGSKVKQIDRRKERHGYNPGEDEKVYEETLEESTYEFDVSGEHGNAAVDKLVKHANSKGIKAKVHTYDGPGGGNPVIHLSHKDPKAVHAYVNKHVYPVNNIARHKINEELKGNQHKIDANKNGKVDAHDFKLLRKKKKVAEEAEQIDEISKKLAIKTYAKRNADAFDRDDYKIGSADREYDKRDRTGARIEKKFGKKTLHKAISAAHKEIFGEESEQIDELSKKTLATYAIKAKNQMGRDEARAGYQRGIRTMDGKGQGEMERAHDRRAEKRSKGIDNALNRLAKEEVEIEEKLNMDKASMGTVIKDFQKSKAPQFKGKSQKKRRAMAIAAKLTAERGGKPLRKEEKLAELLGDLTESHRRTMLSVFDKLNEDNQKKFLEACQTPEGVESMLDFAISHRGE